MNFFQREYAEGLTTKFKKRKEGRLDSSEELEGRLEKIKVQYQGFGGGGGGWIILNIVMI